MPFGAGGPHFCIGSHLAKLEAELLFAEFAERGMALKLAGTPKRLPGKLHQRAARFADARGQILIARTHR
jgi:cytochrome P450